MRVLHVLLVFAMEILHVGQSDSKKKNAMPWKWGRKRKRQKTLLRYCGEMNIP